MFKRLRFAIVYALRNINRSRQRTAFALFSVAAGVATVVALRMLGLMLTDALTSNAKALLRGDVVVMATGNIGVSVVNKNARPEYTSDKISAIQKWAVRNNADVAFSSNPELMQGALLRNGMATSQPAFLFANFIEPQKYPFYDSIRSLDGTPLSQLLTAPDQIVVGKRLAEQLGIKVGDQMHVGAAETPQTVRGIVPDSSENNLTNNPINLVFSFIYVDRAYMDRFGLTANSANRAFVKLPDTMTQLDAIKRIQTEWPRRNGRVRYLTAESVLKQNQFVSTAISRFVLLLSLVALVIGSVGIANTMLVSVNRRSSEIAVLKTLGVQRRNVGFLFFMEALILGIFGSALGLIFGIGLSFIARQFGEQAFGVALPYRITPEPLALGMLLGILTTMMFSLFPTLLAGQVRPGLVLRSGNISLARGGCLTSLVSLLVLLGGLSAFAEAIIGGFSETVMKGLVREVLPPRMGYVAQLPYGIIGTLIVFIFIVIMLALIWVVVWLLGKLPSFRNPTLRIAIRALTLHRSRTALSMLALIIGMTALGGTLIMTRSITQLLSTSLTEPLGGNMIILPFIPFSAPLVANKLDAVPAVDGYRTVRLIRSDLVAVNGDRDYRSKIVIPDDIQSEIAAAPLDQLLGMTVSGNPPRGKLIAGRYLDESDSNQAHIVIPYRDDLARLGVTIGSTFTYAISGQSERTFEVVGIVAPDERSGLIPFSLGDSAIQAPIDAIKPAVPFDLIIATVKPESLKPTMATIGTIPGVFVFDIGIIDSIVNRILSQLAALPLLVAGLSLFAATALIATTVSLATMERRQQTAVLKAIGVSRQQVLNQLLIENGVIGLTGGLISLLPTMLILSAIPQLTEGVINLPVPTDLLVLMLCLSVGLTLFATMLTAWGAANEKPLVALRYE
jgi:putative ABC transport system permease protein